MTIKEISVSDEELRIMLETGYILREAARFNEAEAIFRGMMEFLPESDVPQVGLGTVFLQKGDFSAAEEICEKALVAHPESLYARVHYAEALLFSRQRERAENELREIIGSAPDSPHSQTAQALLEAADLISPKQDSSTNFM
ncbi:MAG TPA: tetratricopeptide repeat protein [Pyrinomonadaceae bacterium]|jgi:predicted Zn-dependent protease